MHSDSRHSTQGSRVDQLRLLARYNRWMNTRLYEASARLDAEAVHAARGAYFGSLFGTLHHLLAADLIWLKRFRRHAADFPSLHAVDAMPQPAGLDHRWHHSLESLAAERCALDGLIEAWVAEISEAALDQPLRYRNTRGIESVRGLHALLTHFFNHQTHHRGQATTLLFQAGIDPGVTDLLAVIPELDIMPP